MSSAIQPSFFAGVTAAPADPILGLTEAFNADDRSNKQNLGVGVYQNGSGQTPLMDVVQKAQGRVMAKQGRAGYLPISGFADYNQLVQALLLGKDCDAIASGRVVTIQALGGTGGLRVGADFLKAHIDSPGLYVSKPTWVNHHGIFGAAGFSIKEYPYYNPETHSVDFECMLDAVSSFPAQSVLLLHTCCHNPTGADLHEQQWRDLLDVVKVRKLIPFFDCAYQGFARGLDQDVLPIRLCEQAGLTFLVAQSFSKSFSLYRRRTGHLTLVVGSQDEAAKVLSQLKIVIRRNYSNPPTEGAEIVAEILSDPTLYAAWVAELDTMRARLVNMRSLLVEKLSQYGVDKDFSFLAKQNGMFSFMGLTKDIVHKLRDDYGIYTVDSSRICVGALNEGNIDYIAEAIAKSLK
ncbi:aspartate/tyrosine/aromatic aminotransferase [Oligoflexia bacterium]|nr:aspartate/tyrosine/aromatic aminotransferase [Oligoflexia bacterium]